MPSRRGLIVRRDPEAGQGQVCARADGHPDPPRWLAPDHFHAVRTVALHGGKSGRCPQDLAVVSYSRSTVIDLAADTGIQAVFRHLAEDAERTAAIANQVMAAFAEGGKVLVLTERAEHLEAIRNALHGLSGSPFVLHGRMSRNQRVAVVAALDALPADAPRILLATGKLVGEGFDHPPLDTLVLAMPVSWRGTLQQYAGRLHREHAGKTKVRIIDFVDTGHAALIRMWEKRQRGYRAMGYRITNSGG